MSAPRGDSEPKHPRVKPPRESAREGSGLTLIDAPWRHELFDSSPEQKRSDGKAESQCFICRAVNAPRRDDARNLLLVRGDRAVIVLNRYPYTMGALMVCPIAHIGDIRDIAEGTLLEMMQLTKQGMSILDRAVHPKGYNIGVNQGAEAGAGLSDHVHLHVVPRWGADTNFMTTTAGSRVLVEDVDSMYRRLRRAKVRLDKKRPL